MSRTHGAFNLGHIQIMQAIRQFEDENDCDAGRELCRIAFGQHPKFQKDPRLQLAALVKVCEYKFSQAAQVDDAQPMLISWEDAAA